MGILSKMKNRWHKTDDNDCQVRDPPKKRSPLYDKMMTQYRNGMSDDDEYIPEGNLDCDAPMLPEPVYEYEETIPTTLEEMREADYIVEDTGPKRISPMPDLSNQRKGLYVGKIIGGGDDIWQVLNLTNDEMKIRVLACGPSKHGSIGSYVDCGKEYTLIHHEGFRSQDFDLWEIPEEQMKRRTSQVLLCGIDGNYTMDLDS